MERCTLCGGRLANGRCMECGLDNTKNDKKYHLNIHNEKGTTLHRGNCEDHLNVDNVRKEKRPDAAKKAVSDARTNQQQKMQQQKHQKEVQKRRQAGTVKQKNPVPVVIAIVFLVLIIISSVQSIIWEIMGLF